MQEGVTTKGAVGVNLFPGHPLPFAGRRFPLRWTAGISRNGDHPSRFLGGARRPVERVRHRDAVEYCVGLTRLHDAAGALPCGGEVVDYQAPAEGLLRIARGGSWLYGAKACRSANRDSYGESTRSSDLGFRVVLAPMDP
jgi:formylglycine-generating enzyme required for sulfatase activity